MSLSLEEDAGWLVLPPKKRTRNAWFSLLCYRRHRVDSVPRTPWDFSLWACSGRDRPWAGGLPVGGHTCRLQGCICARVASPQSSILHCSIDTLAYRFHCQLLAQEFPNAEGRKPSTPGRASRIVRSNVRYYAHGYQCRD